MAIEWERIAKEKGYDSPSEMFKKMYAEQKYTMTDIATILGCSAYAIGAALDKFGVERHRHGGARHFRGKPSVSAIENVLQKLQEEVKK